MKKIVALLLLLALFCPQAMAEGDLEIVQMSVEPVEIYDGYYVAWVAAEIINNGNEERMIEDAPFRIFGKNGEILYENSLFLSYPMVLTPGETAYIWDQANAEEPMALKDMQGYELLIEDCVPYTSHATTLELTDWEILESKTYDDGTEYTVLLTITNDQPETVFHPTAYYGLYDEQGTLLYVGGTTHYDMGILPGQSAVFVFYIDASLNKIWENAGIAPYTIQGGAYLEME